MTRLAAAGRVFLTSALDTGSVLAPVVTLFAWLTLRGVGKLEARDPED